MYFTKSILLSEYASKIRIPRRCYAFQYKKPPPKPDPNSRFGHFLLLVPAGSVGLILYDVFVTRRHDLDKLNSLKAKLKQPPIPLPDNLADLKSMEFTPIKLKGVFDHDSEFVIEPKQRLDEAYLASEKKESIFDLPLGGVVVTPFNLSGRNIKILVARGWVPKDRISKESRLDAQVEGEVELVGVTRNHEKKPPFLITAVDTSKNIYPYRDVEKMAWKYNTAPYYFEATYDSSIPDGPIGGQTYVQLSKAYYVKIFGLLVLAGWTSRVWYKMFFTIRG